ncbi:MAG TPA: FadD3 family acyl-CoA ligase [Microthrixaceae bacterium]|nr:FadD3 family acyl-CoA ligase [Microthrixaceae bacterium]
MVAGEMEGDSMGARRDSGDGPAEEGTRADLSFVTIPALLRAAAARHGDHEVIVDHATSPAVRLSYSELRERVDQLAAALIGSGVQIGDRVAIWAPNCWEWVVALLGLQSAGAVLVPLNTRYKGIEAADILRRSGARMLFTVEGFLGNDYVSMLADPVVGELPDLEQIVLLNDSGARPEGVVTIDELVASSSTQLSEVDARVESLQGSDLSDLLFTSGTTGSPKGVMVSHAQTLRAFGDWGDIVGLESSDRYLVINPFFHAFGYKAGIISSLIAGATLVPVATFDLAIVIDLIKSERISVIPGAPTIYQSLLNHPGFDPAKAKTLRLAVTGAAVVPVELVHQMRDTLGFDTVLTAYGMTEACGIATTCRRDDSAETIAGTSGRAYPGVEVRVVGPEGEELPAGDAGEVLVRGYNVMGGYFEDPKKTAETIDSDGWLHTGDVGVMDDAGYLRITDRIKDMFIVGGFNAYPAEIERLLLVHPDIAQVAVVGVPNERMGETGYAFVVATQGTQPDPAEIITWARANMANFKVPSVVEVVAELPLNASGKVLKFELRDRAVESLAEN